MKKSIKMLISALLAFALVITGLLPSGFVPEAAAESRLTKTVEYDYYGAAFVKLVPSADGTTIRYTTDGTVPTADSEEYPLDSEICVYTKTTIRAAEFNASGKKVSTLKTTIKPKCSPVEFDIDYQIGKSVISLSCQTLGAKIYYTLDGSKPTENSELYLGEITVKEKTKVRAVAIMKDYANSAVYTKTVSIGNFIENDNAPDDDEGTATVKYKFTYMAEKGYMYVTLMPQKSSNIIYYTTDGTKPSKDSKKYSKRIKFTENSTIRAVEYTKKGELVASSKINVKMKCAPVEFDCIDIATGTKTITLSTITEGAAIYYTIDGTTPDPEYSDVYTGPLTLGDKSTLSAVVAKDGWKQSSTKIETVSEIPLHLTDFNFGDPLYSEAAVLLNSYRRSNGLNQLVLDERLTEAANVRAKELSVLMDHTRPTGAGYLSAVADCGVKVRYCAEFISSYYKTPAEFLQSVLSDKGNYSIILGEGYNHNAVGVGYYEKGKSRYWVLLVAETVN